MVKGPLSQSLNISFESWDDFPIEFGITWTNFALYFAVIALAFSFGVEKLLRGEKKSGCILKTTPWLSLVPPFDFLHFLWRLKREGIHLFDEYVAKYGPISSLSGGFFKYYIVSDVTVIEKILSSNDSRLLNKAKIIDSIVKIAGLKDGVGCVEGKVWQKRRKLFSPSFSFKSLQFYLRIIDENAKRMITDFQKEIPSEEGTVPGGKLDPIQNLYLLKSISSIIMRNDVATDEENRQFRSNFEAGLDLTMYRFYNPWFLSDHVWQFHPKRKFYDDWLQGVHGYIDKLIANIKSKCSGASNDTNLGKSSILEYMIDGGLPRKDIHSEVLTFLFAGHETVSLTVTLLIFHLASNPLQQLKCQQEVDDLFNSRDNSEELTIDDLSNLKYLERCILECLRLTPPVPVITRSIETPVLVDKVNTIPAGSNVWISIWSVGRDPEIYPNPLKFDPDRFLPENCKGRSSYAYLPFSAGPRNCIGGKVGIMEAKVVMARIIREFEFSTKEKLENIKFLIEMSLKPEKEIEVDIKRRFSNSVLK